MIIFCKTTEKDFGKLLILLGSIEKHNKDNLKLYLALPREYMSELEI